MLRTRALLLAVNRHLMLVSIVYTHLLPAHFHVHGDAIREILIAELTANPADSRSYHLQHR